MLAEILALFAAVAAPADPATSPPPRTVSPVIVQPAPSTKIEAHPDATVDSPGGADDAIGEYVAIWPRRAHNAGKGGHVTLSCLIDIHGLAEWCKVAAESPAGQGFGAAALELRPTFKVKPDQGPDGPIAAVKTINVGFKAPDLQMDFSQFETELKRRQGGSELGQRAPMDIPMSGNRLAMRSITMVDDPVWVTAPTFDDLARAYPADGGGVEGYAVAHCRVERAGASAGVLHGCVVIKSDPHRPDFAGAALSLTSKFRILPAALAKAPRDAPLFVNVPIRLPPPDQIADRTVKAPIWLLNVDPATAPKVFPPEAAARGLTTGRGVARCTVATDGTMTACAPETGDPDGLGFSEAAAKLASAMQMNLWSADGAPVEGGVVHIAIRLELKAGAD
jgi:TonB family protein